MRESVDHSKSNDHLTALLAEYSSLRQESLAAIQNRITIFSFTFGGLAIAGAALTQTSQILVRLAATLVAVPLLAKGGVLVWMGEYMRSRRAGAHICMIEAAINRHYSRYVLTWESSLKSGAPIGSICEPIFQEHNQSAPVGEDSRPRLRAHMKSPYLATITLLFFTGTFYIAVGVVTAFDYLNGRLSTSSAISWTLAIGVFFGAIEVAAGRFIHSRWVDAQVVGTS